VLGFSYNISAKLEVGKFCLEKNLNGLLT